MAKLSALFYCFEILITMITILNTSIPSPQSKLSLAFQKSTKPILCMSYTWPWCSDRVPENVHIYRCIFSKCFTQPILIRKENYPFWLSNMASSSSSVSKLANQFSKNLYVSQKTTKHVSLQGKKKDHQSFFLIGLVCREDVAISRGVLRFQLRAAWGTDHDFTIISTGRRNVYIFRIHNRALYQRIINGRPHSVGGYLLALMPWDFGMNVKNVNFQFELFKIEFRVRSDLNRDNIPYMVASQTEEVSKLFNRDATGVVKAEVKIDFNLPMCRKVRLTLEDGERVKFALFYLGFPGATCRDCYVINHVQQYCGLVTNLAWLNIPVLTLQGADPFQEQMADQNIQIEQQQPLVVQNQEEGMEIANVQSGGGEVVETNNELVVTEKDGGDAIISVVGGAALETVPAIVGEAVEDGESSMALVLRTNKTIVEDEE